MKCTLQWFRRKYSTFRRICLKIYYLARELTTEYSISWFILGAKLAEGAITQGGLNDLKILRDTLGCNLDFSYHLVKY